VGDLESSDNKNNATTVNIMEPFYNYRGKLKLGKFCCIAADCKIMLDGNSHLTVKSIAISPAATQVKPEKPAPKITIGNDVCIGDNVILLAGVTIGNGAVIAANSYVVKDVAAYTVVEGNPAKLVKNRFSPQQIEKLERIQWWDWPRAQIKENAVLFRDDNIPALFKYAREKKGLDV
jgi:acetyltransferase-like isoleucine patch superfamily enzyme